MSDATVDTTPEESTGGVASVLRRERNFDFIGRSRLFLYISLAVLAIALLGGLLRGLNFSIEFTGGTGYTVNNATNDYTAEDLRDALGDLGVEGSIVQVVDGGDGALISTPALDEIGGEEAREVLAAISEITGASTDDIDVNAVGPRWGQQITEQSLRGLLVFLVLVSIYIAIRFEARMALAALVTLLHDIALTVGLYAVIGFVVSPASVIAFLTILGYSLYDTVVVFDRVKEDTEGLSSVSTRSYGQSANAALNEVLVRSLSTSLTSLLPVGSLLFVGARLLGAETLQDLALALFIGMAIGTYSSIVVATPFLVWLKEKEPKWRELKERVESRRGIPSPSAAAAGGGPTSATRKSTKSKRRR